MKARDRYILAIVAVVGGLGAFWFLGLSPKRAEVAELDKKVVAAEASLKAVESEKAQVAQAQVEFPTLYASVGRLGKAVPGDEDVPSLLVQLNHAANRAGVDFRSVELQLDKDKQAAAEAAPPPAAAGGAEGGAPAEGGAEGGEAGASGGAEGGEAPAATESAAPAAGGTPAAGAEGAAAGAAGTDPAATAGSGLEPLPFKYIFRGDFFEMKRLIGQLDRFVEMRNRELVVSGRLITVDGLTLKRGKVTILATSYLLPAGQSLFAGATPQGPASTDPAQPQAASGTTPPAADPSTAAPPAATVTAP